MMVRVSKAVAVLFCFVLIVSILGCASTRLIDFTIISTKNVNLARGADLRRGAERVEGEDKFSIILFIPTGTPNLKEAVDLAIEDVPGAVALIDGVISFKAWTILGIYGETSYIVEGTPLIDPSIVESKLPSNHIISRIDKKGNVRTQYVSKAEYDSIKKKIGL